jgi:glucose-1-phosphate adenylyltransferase
VHRAILDEGVVVMEGATIGIDHQQDLDRGFIVTEGGVTVVGRDTVVEA